MNSRMEIDYKMKIASGIFGRVTKERANIQNMSYGYNWKERKEEQG